MKELESNIPQNINQWLDEISRAFLDAKDAIPFGKYVGEKITEDQLFHFAPRVAIKFRGIKPSKKNIKQATEAALSTYVANSDREDIQMKDSHWILRIPEAKGGSDQWVKLQPCVVEAIEKYLGRFRLHNEHYRPLKRCRFSSVSVIVNRDRSNRFDRVRSTLS